MRMKGSTFFFLKAYKMSTCHTSFSKPPFTSRWRFSVGAHCCLHPVMAQYSIWGSLGWWVPADKAVDPAGWCVDAVTAASRSQDNSLTCFPFCELTSSANGFSDGSFYGNYYTTLWSVREQAMCKCCCFCFCDVDATEFILALHHGLSLWLFSSVPVNSIQLSWSYLWV